MEQLTEEEYGDNYSQHYFDQYRIYLEGIERISDRRESANKYFFAINSGIIISAAFLIRYINNPFILLPILSAVSVFGIVISLVFFILINSYKHLNSAKFKILHKIEENLPIQMYTREWEHLGKGKDSRKYFPFSHIELFIPIIFGILYFIALIVLIA